MPFGTRKNLGLLFGVIILLIGIIGIITSLNVIGLKLPFSINLLAWILAFGGFYLIFESFTEIGARKITAMIVALFVLFISLIPILHQLGLITFTLPFINLFLFYILLFIEGIFLIINAFGT